MKCYPPMARGMTKFSARFSTELGYTILIYIQKPTDWSYLTTMTAVCTLWKNGISFNVYRLNHHQLRCKRETFKEWAPGTKAAALKKKFRLWIGSLKVSSTFMYNKLASNTNTSSTVNFVVKISVQAPTRWIFESEQLSHFKDYQWSGSYAHQLTKYTISQ